MVPLMRRTKAQMVTNWNDNYAVGQKVRVKRDSGDLLVTTTASEAELLGGHTPVIWLDGISGCYALDRVTPIN